MEEVYIQRNINLEEQVYINNIYKKEFIFDKIINIEILYI